MKTTHSILGGVALALVLLTAGCADDPGDNPKTQVTESPTPTPSKTLSPREQFEEDAKADAQDALTLYFKVVDQVGQNPKLPLSRLGRVAISTMLGVKENSFRNWRKDGWRQTGSLEVTDMRVESVNLGNSDPAAGKVPTVVVTICTDASDVDVLDRTGKSVVLDSRPDVVTTEYTVANYSWKSDKRGGWRVAVGKDTEAGSCAL
jgi:hypothetical protein